MQGDLAHSSTPFSPFISMLDHPVANLDWPSSTAKMTPILAATDKLM
jgi:hypothetical protein